MLAALGDSRREVRDAYNGNLTVDLPGIGRQERSAVANLLNGGTIGNGLATLLNQLLGLLGV